jgi:hypothetical protein
MFGFLSRLFRRRTPVADGPIRITLEMLHDTVNGFPAEVRQNGVNQSLTLAMAILKHYFGEDWLNQYVTPDTAQKNFLRLDESSSAKLDLSAVRVIDLAEVIYNLQGIDGFDDCISRMRDGDIEGTFAELDLGRMLYLNEVAFRYVKPSGVKGADFDVEITYPNGLVACADAKCKIETTEFGDKTIANTLGSARKQLPKDRPGIVFVKVPQGWMDDPKFVQVCVDVANDFLRGTGRVVSVKYYVSPLTFEGGFLKQQHAYKEISNSKTEFGEGSNWNLFRQFDLPPEANGMPPHWQRVLFFPDGKVR